MSLEGRHAVITGGGSGVGAAIAREFADQGARVTIMGRTEAALRAQSLPYQICDVSDADSVEAAFAGARDQSGPTDIVIANAGAAASAPFSSMTYQDLSAMLAVNLAGVFNVWRAGLDDMKRARWGRMIAIASTAGLKGYAYASAYSAAKHGVIGLTRSLALELADTGITVNAICPGFVETPMLTRSIDTIMDKTGMDEAAARKALKSGNPQKRFIQTDEIAETARFLCTDGARSINGHALSLSGGEI